MKTKIVAGAILFCILILILLLIASYHSTESTEVGVRTRKWSLFSKSGVENRSYNPGSTYFFLPILNDWDVFDTKIQVVEMRKQEQLSFKTIEGNDLQLDIRFAYRLDPARAPYVRQFVARNTEELRHKIFNTIGRSRTRDFFGELTTQQFYNAEDRNLATERAKTGLQTILQEYGIILESVSLMDYRFNEAYAQIIEQKKISEQNKSQIEARMIAQKEENIRMQNEARGIVNGMVAQVDGLFTNTVAMADAYFDQQRIIAEATVIEGQNQAESIRKKREAMSKAGGETQVRMKIAENLKGKRIIMLPANESSLNVHTLDLNRFLELYGIRSLSEKNR